VISAPGQPYDGIARCLCALEIRRSADGWISPPVESRASRLEPVLEFGASLPGATFKMLEAALDRHLPCCRTAAAIRVDLLLAN